MKCSKCEVDNDIVIDSRIVFDGMRIRRRRRCLKCGNRWTTYEVSVVEITPSARKKLREITACIISHNVRELNLFTRLEKLIAEIEGELSFKKENETENNEGSEDPMVNGSSVDMGKVSETSPAKRPVAR